jgi:alpha-mannosidase
MRATSVELTCTGPALAEAVTSGEIVDQATGDVLAGFRQTIRVWRGRPVVELDIELEPTRLPDGDPWTNYYACRFAWNDETAAVTRSVQQTAQPAPDGRFDAPHYIEIAEEELRTTIVPVGLPFHRRTGGRMLDTLLVVAGESARRFRFAIVCDEFYPLRPALDAYVPPVVVETDHGPPPAGPAGWFLHLDAKNAQITSLRPLPPSDDQPPGLRVRLTETEGVTKPVRLTCFKTPSSARLVNLAGEPITNLRVEGDAVPLELHRFEIATVELRF